jgi:hypothetical protein
MGVKFNREYKDILADLTEAIGEIPDCYSFFEMEELDWDTLGDRERQELVQTLSDDLFYALGQQKSIEVGSGQIEYDPRNHLIKVITGPQVVRIVRLI